MATVIYLNTVKNDATDDRICVHSCVVNPNARKEEERYNDTFFFASPIGYTRIKLAELCRILENTKPEDLPNEAQILVYAEDDNIARTGKRFGVEFGDSVPVHNRDMWERLEKVCTNRNFQIAFGNRGLASDSVDDDTNVYISSYSGRGNRSARKSD